MQQSECYYRELKIEFIFLTLLPQPLVWDLFTYLVVLASSLSPVSCELGLTVSDRASVCPHVIVCVAVQPNNQHWVGYVPAVFTS